MLLKFAICQTHCYSLPRDRIILVSADDWVTFNISGTGGEKLVYRVLSVDTFPSFRHMLLHFGVRRCLSPWKRGLPSTTSWLAAAEHLVQSLRCLLVSPHSVCSQSGDASRQALRWRESLFPSVEESAAADGCAACAHTARAAVVKKSQPRLASKGCLACVT